MVIKPEREFDEQIRFLICESQAEAELTAGAGAAVAEEIKVPHKRVSTALMAIPDNKTIEQMVERVERKLDKECEYQRTKSATPVTAATAATLSMIAAITVETTSVDKDEPAQKVSAEPE